MSNKCKDKNQSVRKLMKGIALKVALFIACLNDCRETHCFISFSKLFQILVPLYANVRWPVRLSAESDLLFLVPVLFLLLAEYYSDLIINKNERNPNEL